MSTKKGNEEQRAYKRFSTGDNCLAQLDTTDKIALKNISLFGTCLIVSRHLDKNSAHEITVYSGKKDRIILDGCVIWSYPMGQDMSGDSEISYYETGFKFINLDDAKKNALIEFISGLG